MVLHIQHHQRKRPDTRKHCVRRVGRRLAFSLPTLISTQLTQNATRHLHSPGERPPKLLPHLRPRPPRLPTTKLRHRSPSTPDSRPRGHRLLGRRRRQRHQQHRHRHDRRHPRRRRPTHRDGHGCPHKRDVPLRLQPAERERHQPESLVRKYLGDGEFDWEEGSAGFEYVRGRCHEAIAAESACEPIGNVHRGGKTCFGISDEGQRREGPFSSVYSAFCRHLSGWTRLGRHRATMIRVSCI